MDTDSTIPGIQVKFGRFERGPYPKQFYLYFSASWIPFNLNFLVFSSLPTLAQIVRLVYWHYKSQLHTNNSVCESSQSHPDKCDWISDMQNTKKCGRSYFADLRMTFRQNFFLQDWFGNKLGVGLVVGIGLVLVLVRSLLCYVLSLWGQRNKLFLKMFTSKKRFYTFLWESTHSHPSERQNRWCEPMWIGLRWMTCQTDDDCYVSFI
jgi:hypothetical protein